ncbi:MAG TPA: hypothetical protein VFC23_05680 [Thermoanaerobaculia bacterium]|nr:hypothetical protein [Thermoanaerobaculia bacterium]
MMRSALYYPHTTIRSEQLVKTSLLLWDRVEVIVPDPGYKPYYSDRLLARAMEIIGERHYPTDDEKREAHAHIEDFVTRPLPKSFYYIQEGGDHRSDYEIYPQKLFPETWKMLRDAQFAGNPLANDDYPLSVPAGLAIMSVLADCCAGSTRRRVTDRDAAYATLADLLGSGPEEEFENPGTSPEQLVPISLEIVDASEIDLKSLIQFREREEQQGGHHIRDLRHRYVERIEAYVTTLTTVKGKESDEGEIKRQFRDDMRDDLAGLRDALGLARNEVLFSKEMITSAIVGVGTLASLAFGPLAIAGMVTIGGAPVTIGGVLGVKNKYLSSRRSILEKHPMAYLLELVEPKRWTRFW